MGLLTSGKLLAAGIAWRVAGAPAAGRMLVDAVSAGDEAERAMAGMLLVRAGDRSVPIVTQRLADGRGSLELFDVLVSIGSDAARASLELLVAGSRPDVAASAAEALDTLDQIRRHGD